MRIKVIALRTAKRQTDRVIRKAYTANKGLDNNLLIWHYPSNGCCYTDRY